MDRKMTLAILKLILLPLVLFTCGADRVYRYVEPDGTVLYTNVPREKDVTGAVQDHGRRSHQTATGFEAGPLLAGDYREIGNAETGMSKFSSRLQDACKSGTETTVFHIGDSHVQSPALAKHIEKNFQQGCGNRGVGSVRYYSLGANGKTFGYFSGLKAMYDRLSLVKPDLVIVTLGTNDAFSAGFNKGTLEREIISLGSGIRAVLPEVSILFTTPADSRWKSGGVNENIGKVRDVIISVSARYGYSYWDLFSIMGGETSIDRWYTAGLTGEDRVHFKSAGYKKIGDMLYQAILYSCEKRRPSA